jgi:hypothetical protein
LCKMVPESTPDATRVAVLLCETNAPELSANRMQHGLCGFCQGGARLHHAQGLPGEEEFDVHLRAARYPGFQDLCSGRIHGVQTFCQPASKLRGQRDTGVLDMKAHGGLLFILPCWQQDASVPTPFPSLSSPPRTDRNGDLAPGSRGRPVGRPTKGHIQRRGFWSRSESTDRANAAADQCTDAGAPRRLW